MIELIFLAIALSMDAFAVSIGLGSKNTQALPLALKSAVYFGVFQALMPLLGFLGGKGLLGWLEGFTHWVAFLLLALIGGKMIYEALSNGIEDEITRVSHRVMLVLAIATSVDAMAAGFTLTLLPVNPLIACAVIGLTTFCLSGLGVLVGNTCGTWLESKAEFLGGVILIIIGLRILLF